MKLVTSNRNRKPTMTSNANTLAEIANVADALLSALPFIMATVGFAVARSLRCRRAFA